MVRARDKRKPDRRKRDRIPQQPRRTKERHREDGVQINIFYYNFFCHILFILPFLTFTIYSQGFNFTILTPNSLQNIVFFKVYSGGVTNYKKLHFYCKLDRRTLCKCNVLICILHPTLIFLPSSLPQILVTERPCCTSSF